jgi:hypothetical protein
MSIADKVKFSNLPIDKLQPTLHILNQLVADDDMLVNQHKVTETKQDCYSRSDSITYLHQTFNTHILYLNF